MLEILEIRYKSMKKIKNTNYLRHSVEVLYNYNKISTYSLEFNTKMSITDQEVQEIIKQNLLELHTYF